MKYLFIIMTVWLMSSCVHAQINAFYVLSPMGSFSKVPDKGMLSATVGQMMTRTLKVGGFIITQGFQQGSILKSPLGGALPVTLITFDGYNNDGVNHLTWQTASEINNEGFDVERLDATNDFQKIGYVAGHGNTNSLQEYTYDDKQPLNGDNYYRLKQTDVDGKYTYTDVISIFAGTGIGTSVSVFPIPVTDQLHIVIHNAEATSGSIAITNIVGENVYEGSVDIYDGTTVRQIDMRAYAPGQYFVKLTTGSTTKTIHIVRQ